MRLTAVLTALAAIPLLAGCDPDVPEAVSVVPPPATSSSEVMEDADVADEVFLATVRGAATEEAAIMIDDEIIEAALTFCDSMDRMGVEETYWMTLEEVMYTDYAEELTTLFGVIIGAGVPTYCPQHEAELRELVGY